MWIVKYYILANCADAARLSKALYEGKLKVAGVEGEDSPREKLALCPSWVGKSEPIGSCRFDGFHEAACYEPRQRARTQCIDKGKSASYKCPRESPQMCRIAPVGTIDPELDFTKPVQVTISYQSKKPSSFAAAGETGCNSGEYRLVLGKDGKLALVAVDDGIPCDPKWKEDDLHAWQVSNGGMFSAPEGPKRCLAATQSYGLTTSDSACTADNSIGGLGWHFSQDNVFSSDGTDLCMPSIPKADPGQNLVVLEHDLHIADTMPECSSSWEMKVFRPNQKLLLQTDLLQQTTLSCSDCPESKWGFVCATDKCELAPTSSDCAELGGEWCTGSPPAPTYPSWASGWCPTWVGNQRPEGHTQRSGLCKDGVHEGACYGKDTQTITVQCLLNGKAADYPCPSESPKKCAFQPGDLKHLLAELEEEHAPSGP